MAVVKPIPTDKATGDVAPIFEDLMKRFGKVPGIFGMMAHRPSVLKAFLSFYGAVVREGTVDARYKELAYLKTSMVNGCEY